MKEFKPKTKEKWRKDATIKIKTFLEVVENPKGCFTNNEKLINIDIDKGYMGTSQSFNCTKKGTKELLEFIKNELYLK